MPTLQEVHGDGDCYICGKPKAGEGGDFCSYPHGMIPDKPVSEVDGIAMWTWKLPEAQQPSEP